MSEPVNADSTVAVGTGGSESSPRAVGDRGPNSLGGRLLGSVPADADRRSRCDGPIVHTTG